MLISELIFTEITEKYHPIRKDDTSKLSNTVFDTIQQSIKKIAKDPNVDLIDPLDLVHKAYDYAQVQRPTPSMRAGWEQYEENITFAVRQFDKYRK